MKFADLGAPPCMPAQSIRPPAPCVGGCRRSTPEGSGFYLHRTIWLRNFNNSRRYVCMRTATANVAQTAIVAERGYAPHPARTVCFDAVAPAALVRIAAKCEEVFQSVLLRKYGSIPQGSSVAKRPADLRLGRSMLNQGDNACYVVVARAPVERRLLGATRPKNVRHSVGVGTMRNETGDRVGDVGPMTRPVCRVV